MARQKDRPGRDITLGHRTEKTENKARPQNQETG